jgi:hypothetical protein
MPKKLSRVTSCFPLTATFRLLYVLVALEVESRRIVHCNVTEHPTAEWTTQQFREFLAFDHPYRFVIHDRDAIFAAKVDQTLKGFGIRLKTPVRDSGTTPGQRSGQRPQAQAARLLPRQIDTGPRRTAS